MSDESKTYADGLKEAYEAACRIADRDWQSGVDDFGTIDNILAELAKLADMP